MEIDGEERVASKALTARQEKVHNRMMQNISSLSSLCDCMNEPGDAKEEEVGLEPIRLGVPHPTIERLSNIRWMKVLMHSGVNEELLGEVKRGKYHLDAEKRKVCDEMSGLVMQLAALSLELLGSVDNEEDEEG